MPERNVVLNFLTRGDADTRNTMRLVGREADHLDGKNVDLTLGAKDEPAKKKFLELKLMGERFQKAVYEARATVNDKEALLKLDKLSFKAHKLVEKPYDMRVGIDGYEKAKLELRSLDILADRATRHRTLHIRTDRSGGFGGGGGLSGIFRAGGGGAGAAAQGGLPGLTGAAGTPVGAGAIAGIATLLATITPAVLGLGIGGAVGFGGAAGALALGQHGATKLAADRKALQSAQAAAASAHRSLVAAQGSPHSRGLGAAQARTAITDANLRQAEAQQARDKSIFGAPALTPAQRQQSLNPNAPPVPKPFGLTALVPAFTQLKNTGIETFAKAVQPLAQALVPIMKQIGSFIKSEGPALSNMFKASIPFIRAFVKIFEQAAKQLIPAFTQIMKQLAPHLPAIVQGVLGIVKAFTKFLNLVGGKGGLNGSVRFLLGTFKLVDIIIIATGGFILGLIKVFQTVSHWIGVFTSDVAKAWHYIVKHTESLAHDFHTLFFTIYHFVVEVWQKTWGWVKKTAEEGWHRVTTIVRNLWHDVSHFFSNLWNDIKHIWDTLWSWVKHRVADAYHDVVNTVKSIWHNVVHFFTTLWNDIKHIWDTLWSWVKTRVQSGEHDVIGVVKGLWHDIVRFFQGLKSDVVGVWDRLWSDIKNAGKTAVNWVITHVLNPLIKAYDKVASIGGSLNPLPNINPIPTLARGGWVGGRGGPMADTEHVMLSSGERVLSHKEIGHMGGPKAVDHMAGGPGGGGNGHFAKGGTVPGPGSNRISTSTLVQATGGIADFLKHPEKTLSGNTAVDTLTNAFSQVIFGHTGRSHLSGAVGGVGDSMVQHLIQVMAAAIQSAGGGGTAGLKNPYRKIKGLTPERIDMGVDFGGTGPIYAIGPGVIGQTMNSGWPGGAFIEEKLGSGTPYAGKFVYQAENIHPTVHRGQKVTTNTVVGNMTGGIEAGWSAGTGGLTMAAKTGQQAHGVDPGGHGTWFGHNFDEMLIALGVPKAPNFGGKAFGKAFPGFYNKNAGGNATAGSAIHNGKAIYDYLRANLFGGNKIAAAGAIASIYGESGWNPESQGTGGRGLIGWTPPGTLPNSAFTGNATHDLNAQLPQILAFVKRSGDQGAISEMKRVKTILEAATIWDKRVERAGIFDVHGAGLSLAQKIMGMKHGGMITEEIFGVGRSGQRYHFGEDGVHERVTPVRSGAHGGGGDTLIFQIAPLGDPHKQAKAIHEVLRDYKRTGKGGQKLGLD